MEYTCRHVSTGFKQVPEDVLQNRETQTVVLPPVANRFACHGQHATASTAAVCELNG